MSGQGSGGGQAGRRLPIAPAQLRGEGNLSRDCEHAGERRMLSCAILVVIIEAK